MLATFERSERIFRILRENFWIVIEWSVFPLDFFDKRAMVLISIVVLTETKG